MMIGYTAATLARTGPRRRHGAANDGDTTPMCSPGQALRGCDLLYSWPHPIAAGADAHLNLVRSAGGPAVRRRSTVQPVVQLQTDAKVLGLINAIRQHAGLPVLVGHQLLAARPGRRCKTWSLSVTSRICHPRATAYTCELPPPTTGGVATCRRERRVRQPNASTVLTACRDNLANILNCRYAELGVGVAADSNGTLV